MAEKSLKFGIKLKELMKKKGLTQEELAIKVEVHQTAISNYIRMGTWSAGENSRHGRSSRR
jgi:predicted transcriptional regulator